MRLTFSTLSALAFSLSFGVAACGASDATTTTDNGVDAGTTPALDAGSTTPAEDAGTTPPPPVTDAGSPPPPPPPADAGTPPASDAGGSQFPVWNLRLTVPRNYTGTPRSLSVVLVNSLPVSTIPSAFLLTRDNPTVVAGQDIVLQGPLPTNRGPFRVLAVLYMQGGGLFTPKAGTDYDVASAANVNITGATVDFGTLPLALHTATDGH